MCQSKTEHERLWNLINDALSETDHKIANQIFSDAEQLGRQLHDREPDNAEHCYAIALTFYHRWASQIVSRRCLAWLNKTAKLNPSHPWVPLYLGYQFMDDHRYSDAIKQFRRVDQSYFASIELHWRNIKTDELLLVALLRNGATEIDTMQLERLADRYANAEEVDRPSPTEIVKTLAKEEYRHRFDTPAQNIASVACRLIYACGVESVFSNELQDLETAAKLTD